MNVELLEQIAAAARARVPSLDEAAALEVAIAAARVVEEPATIGTSLALCRVCRSPRREPGE